MRDLSKMSDTVSKAAVGYERIQEVVQLESRVRNLPGAREGTAVPRCDRVRSRQLQLSRRRVRAERRQLPDRAGPGGGDRGAVGHGQVDDRQPHSALLRFPRRDRSGFDGCDVRDFTLKSLRDQISFVLQDTMLFHATLWENIAYGRPDASVEDTVRAAKLANAHDFIVNMPQGYATMCGERGVTLSGGQRQRIASRARHRAQRADPDSRRADDGPRRRVRTGGHRRTGSLDGGPGRRS